MTIYDIPRIVNSSLHLAGSTGNIKAGFQLSGICLFNRDFFMTKNLWGLRSTPPVAAAPSNSNSKPPKTSTDSPGPSTSTSKEERHPSSPDDI